MPAQKLAYSMRLAWAYGFGPWGRYPMLPFEGITADEKKASEPPKKTHPKTEEELAERFDADLPSLGFDVEKAQVEQPALKRVNVDFPEHMLAMLDREAELRGINRQALIKTWLYERLHAAQK